MESRRVSAKGCFSFRMRGVGWLATPIVRRLRRLGLAHRARRDSVDTVITTVKAFAGEPDVLYVALDYVHHSGMTVTMAPDPGRAEPSS